jgi:protein-tyrosine-phosphatase
MASDPLAQRKALESLIEHVRLLSAEMKLLAAEHAHQQLLECMSQRQQNLDSLFADYMQYLTEEDLSRISHILMIDKEIEVLVGDYQKKVQESFDVNKRKIKAHKIYRDQDKS